MFNYTLICFIINTHCLHVTYWFIFQCIVQINNVRLIAIQSHDIIDPTHYMYWLLCVPLNYTFPNYIHRNRGAGTPQNCKNSHKKWLWPKLQCALCEPSLLPLPFQYFLPMPLQKGFFGGVFSSVFPYLNKTVSVGIFLICLQNMYVYWHYYVSGVCTAFMIRANVNDTLV